MALVVASSLPVTAYDMIKRAMFLVEAIGTGQTPSAEEGVTGLHALNSMLDSWNLEALNVPCYIQISGSLPASTASRTIGDAGNFDVVRPITIDYAFVRDGSSDYPIDIRTIEEYDSIQDKTAPGTPRAVYYHPAFPLGTLYFYPVPDKTYTLYLRHSEQLQYFDSLTDVVYLPPGYRRAIEYNLAIEIASEFGMQIPVNVALVASTSKGNIKRANYKIPSADVEVAFQAGRSNIYTG